MLKKLPLLSSHACGPPVLFTILLRDTYFKTFVQSYEKMTVTSVGQGRILWPAVLDRAEWSETCVQMMNWKKVADSAAHAGGKPLPEAGKVSEEWQPCFLLQQLMFWC